VFSVLSVEQNNHPHGYHFSETFLWNLYLKLKEIMLSSNSVYCSSKGEL
jgi:hypothetical protein